MGIRFKKDKMYYHIIVYLALSIALVKNTQENLLLGSWVLVKQNFSLIFDCHEVLLFDENTYEIFDCDIDYSNSPTMIEEGRYKRDYHKIQIYSRGYKTVKNKFFEFSKNKFDLEINKLSRDSLVVSFKQENKIMKMEFRRSFVDFTSIKK